MLLLGHFDRRMAELQKLTRSATPKTNRRGRATTMLTWEQFMAPVLRALTDGQTRRFRELAGLVATQVGLTEQERAEILASGQERYVNRIGWACSYLSRVGALDKPARGRYLVTDAGRRLLANHGQALTERAIETLAVDPSTGLTPYVAAERATPSTDAEEADSALSPEEQVQDGVLRIHDQVADDLLDRLRRQTPGFFERAVLDLLIAMGYGGTEGQATRTQLSRDGGIDGVIDQDALGLGRIYVQANRYSDGNSVGRPEVQGFVGALQGQRSSQGVFITTSRFTADAAEYARTLNSRVILIDG
jgi:restriction system protein